MNLRRLPNYKNYLQRMCSSFKWCDGEDGFVPDPECSPGSRSSSLLPPPRGITSSIQPKDSSLLSSPPNFVSLLCLSLPSLIVLVQHVKWAADKEEEHLKYWEIKFTFIFIFITIQSQMIHSRPSLRSVLAPVWILSPRMWILVLLALVELVCSCTCPVVVGRQSECQILPRGVGDEPNNN